MAEGLSAFAEDHERPAFVAEAISAEWAKPVEASLGTISQFGSRGNGLILLRRLMGMQLFSDLITYYLLDSLLAAHWP